MNVPGELFASGSRHRQPLSRLVWLGVIALSLQTSTAFAQLARVGNSQGVITPPNTLRGSDVAFDPVNNVYLLVAANGPMLGVFTDVNGAVAPGTAQFQIGNATGDPNYAQFPRVTYSRDVNNGQGGFLVTWHQNDGKPNHVHAQLVAYPNGPIAAERQVSDDQQGGSWWEAGAPVAYSSTSRRFLVAWQTLANGHIHGRFVDLTGAPTGSVMDIENQCSRDPGLAWNSATDDFGLSSSAYCGGTSAGAFAAFRRIAASSGAASARTTFGYTGGTFITDITFNPATRHWIMGYATAAPLFYAEIDESGTLLGTGLLGVGTYDSLGLAFNSTSGTILAVGQGNSSEVLGLETNGKGVPMSSAVALTNGGGTRGSFYPRTTARARAKNWAISYSRQFVQGTIQIVSTSAALGGPESDIRINIDSPATGTTLQASTSFTVRGWALDTAATSSTGIDAVHVYAFVAGSTTGTFVGAATSFETRTDVGGVLGTQFTNSGFSVPVSGLQPGTYTISAYPHSTVTGQFGPPKSITITINGGSPVMAIDSPGTNTTQNQGFTIGGWAIDRGASSGTGVDIVLALAFPVSGGGTIFAGVGVPFTRPDIGGVFGAQFTGAGFNIPITGLPSGTYDISVYPRSTVSGTFNQSATIRVTIR